MKIHYSGGLRTRFGKKGLRIALPGWAACTSGEKAEKIRRAGNQTRDRDDVTCAACLKLFEKELPTP